jgi:hypothetical protein
MDIPSHRVINESGGQSLEISLDHPPDKALVSRSVSYQLFKLR